MRPRHPVRTAAAGPRGRCRAPRPRETVRRARTDPAVGPPAAAEGHWGATPARRRAHGWGAGDHVAAARISFFVLCPHAGPRPPSRHRGALLGTLAGCTRPGADRARTGDL